MPDSDTTCSIDGCERPARARGWCRLHYKRNYRNGDPLKTHKPWGRDGSRNRMCETEGCARKARSRRMCNTHYSQWWHASCLPISAEDFYQRARKCEDGCWRYGSHADHKYVEVHGVRAHRLSYTLSNGPIPDGMVVRHTCDVPICVNPDHLLVGTQKDNCADKMQRLRHAHGEAVWCAILTEEDVRDIRASDSTSTELARKYGMSSSGIWSARSGATWGHIK